MSIDEKANKTVDMSERISAILKEAEGDTTTTMSVLTLITVRAIVDTVPEEKFEDAVVKMFTFVLQGGPIFYLKKLTDELKQSFPRHKWEATCPHCGVKFDGVMGMQVSTEPPAAGSIGLCIMCGEFSVYDDNGQLRVPTDDEIMLIGKSKHAQNVRRSWDATVRQKKGDNDGEGGDNTS